jgi:asparagine synthase
MAELLAAERNESTEPVIVERGNVRDLLGVDNSLELPDQVLHWRGFVYLPGRRAGADSLASCDWSSGIDGVRAAARALKGSYLLSVMERGGDRHYVFTDAGGHFQAFLAGDAVSTSFLGLCDRANVQFSDLDPHAIAELLDLGNVYLDRTLVPSVRPLTPGFVYELIGGTRPAEHAATVPGIDVPPPDELTMERFFRDLSDALRGLRVSVDLTGGSDSRLVATLLARDLDIECAVTGVPGNVDIQISARVARTLDRPLHVLYHQIGELESELPELFDVSDALCDMLAFHRMRQNALARCGRGAQVALTGAGGELYKDFWWLQDLPRYRSHHANLERLFDLRFRAVGLPVGMLRGEYATAAAELRDRMLHAMRELVMPLNTQTYDRIYYDMKMRTMAARFITMTSRFLSCDSPLLDPELIRVGFALPRGERFFNRFHRHILTAASPAVARLGTAEGGMSLSTEPARQAADSIAYTGDKLRRLTAKLGERLGGGSLRQQRPDHPGLISAARSSPAFGASVRRLRACGVLARGVDEATVPDRYVGRVLTLGLFAERLAG